MKTVPKPSDHPTASRVIYTSASLIVFIMFTLTMLLTACSSTSIEELKPDISTNDDDLVITLSTPDTYTFPSSRADETGIHTGHQLRYVAILYKSLTSSTNEVGINGTENLVQRQEILDKNDKQIVFRSVAEGDYFIVAFADYIDANAVASEGRYPDKYYDTNGTDLIKLKELDDPTLYFNNDNLDFFLYHTKSFKKKKFTPEVFDVTLPRRVSKVEVISDGGNVKALNNIDITNSSILQEIHIISGTATATDAKNVRATGIKAADDTSNLLFYYYTFSVGGPDRALENIDFKLNANEGYEFTPSSFQIPKETISPEANIIYKVKGAFLNTSKAPSEIQEIKVTTNENWNDITKDLTN